MAFIELSRGNNPKAMVKVNNALNYKDKEGEIKEKKIETALTEIVNEANKVVGMNKGTVVLTMQVKDEYKNYFVNKDEENNIVLKPASNPNDKDNYIYFNQKMKADNVHYYYKLSNANGADKLIENIDINSIENKNKTKSSYLKVSVSLANDDIKEELIKKGAGHTAIVSKDGYNIVSNDELSKNNEAKKKEQFKPKKRELDNSQDRER